MFRCFFVLALLGALTGCGQSTPPPAPQAQAASPSATQGDAVLKFSEDSAGVSNASPVLPKTPITQESTVKTGDLAKIKADAEKAEAAQAASPSKTQGDAVLKFSEAAAAVSNVSPVLPKPNQKKSDAHVLAEAEYGEIAANDPRIKELGRALDRAAKVFHTPRREIARIAFHHAWQARQKDIEVTTLAYLIDGPKLLRDRPKLGANLAGFTKFAEIYGGSVRSAKVWSEVSAAQGVIKFDTGRVSNDVETTDAVISVIREAAKHYHTDAPMIAAMAIGAAKENRPNTSALALIKASTAPAVLEKQGTRPNFGTFMIFAANFKQ